MCDCERRATKGEERREADRGERRKAKASEGKRKATTMETSAERERERRDGLLGGADGRGWTRMDGQTAARVGGMRMHACGAHECA